MESPPSWLGVDSTDEVLYSGNPSPFILAPEVLTTLFISLVTSYVIAKGPLSGLSVLGLSIQDYLLILLSLSFVFIGYMDIRRRFTEYVATTESVHKKTGILSKNSDSIPVDSIQAADRDQNPLQRVFDIADVTIESASSAGVTQIEWDSVSDPDRIVGVIEKQLSGGHAGRSQRDSASSTETDDREDSTDAEDSPGFLGWILGSDDQQTAADDEQGAVADGSGEQEPSSDGGSDGTPPGFH